MVGRRQGMEEFARAIKEEGCGLQSDLTQRSARKRRLAPFWNIESFWRSYSHLSRAESHPHRVPKRAWS